MGREWRVVRVPKMIYLVAFLRWLSSDQQSPAELGGAHIRDQIVPILGLFQTTKCHLGTRDVFLRVLEVFELRIASTVPIKR